VSSNFGKLVGKNAKLIKTIRNQAHLRGGYINRTLMRKLGLYIYSLTSQIF